MTHVNMARAIQWQGLCAIANGPLSICVWEPVSRLRRRKARDHERLSADRVTPAQFLSDTGRKGQDLPRIALKTLTKYCGFYNAPNEIKVSNQTTNLGGQEFESLRARHFSFQINDSRGRVGAPIGAAKWWRICRIFKSGAELPYLARTWSLGLRVRCITKGV